MQSIDKPIAIWGLCNPCRAAQLDELIKSKGWGAKGLKGNVLFDVDMMKQARRELGVDPDTNRTWFVIMPQMPGEIVNIPAGWLHAVVNVQVSIILRFYTEHVLF